MNNFLKYQQLLAVPLMLCALSSMAQSRDGYTATATEQTKFRLYATSNGDVIAKKTPRGDSYFIYGAHGIQTELSASGTVWQYFYKSTGELDRVELPDGRKIAIVMDKHGVAVGDPATGKQSRVPNDSNAMRNGAMPLPSSSPRLQAAIEDVAFAGGGTFCPVEDPDQCIVIIDGPGGGSGGGIYIPPSGGGGGNTGGGGGGGSTGDSRNVYGGDDGTRGFEANFNRFKWGCAKESNALFELASDVYRTGNFVGVQYPITVADPMYPDGQWIKVETDIHAQDWVAGKPPVNYFMRIHYMYNVTTHQMHQIKFKTSYESGCIGRQ